jgi:methylthioribose-1-phosphate isomerase
LSVETIRWIGGSIRILDQTKLPTEIIYTECRDVEAIAEAIERLCVRGAPAIGVAGAYGVLLGVQGSEIDTWETFEREVDRTIQRLAATRPTAVNLFWALDRMRRVVEMHQGEPIQAVKHLLLEEADRIFEEDRMTCRRLGHYGAELLEDGMTVLTHCNAGGLATADYGTALGVIYAAHEQGKRIQVFADETRPLLQGARLTTWELMQDRIDVTLICDSMAAWVMQQGKVDAVIVGADRIAANGDVANKIGTYGLAVLAERHEIPFFVAAPVSTLDARLSSGAQIPIEERKPEEITEGFGRRTAPEGVRVYNPAFDVTPHHLVSAIISEKGIARAPYREVLRRWTSDA